MKIREIKNAGQAGVIKDEFSKTENLKMDRVYTFWILCNILEGDGEQLLENVKDIKERIGERLPLSKEEIEKNFEIFLKFDHILVDAEGKLCLTKKGKDVWQIFKKTIEKMISNMKNF